ncbi:MAG: PKD domain-containing protein [Firmicutes bacterium]|nr:PKD domain-containing protein [Bacillota bacterium]
MKKILKRATAILIAMVLSFGSFPAYALDAAAEAKASEQIGKVSGVWTLDMWHYSGGYWKVGNAGNDKIRIDDRDITSLDSYLQANQQAVFTISVPQEIAALVSEGTRGTDWQVEFANYRWRDCSMLFAESGPQNVTLKDGKIEFTATPVFHFNNSGASLRDYVPGMAVTVPLVDKMWGCNIYSVFGNGQSAVQGLGYYNEVDPSDTGSNAIHPSFITGKSGTLESGHPITLGMNVVDSAGYSIGSGTFAAAGACGLHFEFPVSLVFTDLRIPDPGDDPGNGGDPGTDPNDPGNGGDGPGAGGDPNDPGNPGGGGDPVDPTDPAEPVDPADISALSAELDLPQTAYAGHDVAAKDVSLYTVDGKNINAARAAELGLGKSSFTIVQKGVGTIRKSGKTGAVAVFSKPGTYQVRLTAQATNGLKDTDTKSIKILKTPAILEDLGGVQKENRKQVLYVTVAQNPKTPVNELTIKLSEPESGESITVSKVFGGAENAPANSAHIKYRSLKDAGSDECFLCVELDFLTKWHEGKYLSYEIHAKDSAGNTDAAYGTFPVDPDLPPFAAIDLEEVYYRNEGSNTASITALCASSSDGDALQRTWEYRREGGSWQSIPAMPGYADLSFGSGKQIRFHQTGVGPFEVRLTVKDRWTEETLEEYVTEADRLSAVATDRSYVDNVAPRVGLDLLRTETAEVFVLTETDKLQRDVLAAAPSLKAAMLSEGIALDVSADFRQAKAGDQTGELKENTTGGHGAKDYRDGESQLFHTYFKGMWDGGNIVADGRYTYLLEPTVQTYAANPKYSIHTYPFTLTARDADGNVVWTTTVTKSILNSPTELRDAVWGFDADGTYLYLIDGSKTALFDIRTGTYVSTLDVTLGTFNLVTPEAIYAFKDNGIYRMRRSGGALKCVYAGEISCPAYLGGAVHFLLKADLGKGLGLYRGVFDPGSEKVKCTLLEGSLAGYARDTQGIAIDTAGAIFAWSGGNAYCFDADDLLIKTIPLRNSSHTRAVTPVRTGNGRVNYIAQTGYERYPKSYEVWCQCSAVYTDDVFSDRRTKEDNYPNFGDPVVFALEDENGAIGIDLGCNYVYSTGERYLDTVLFTFNGDFRNPLGFPMEHGYQSLRYDVSTANLDGRADIKQFVHVAESRADEEERLKAKHLSGTKNYSYYMTLDGPQTQESVASALDNAAAAIKALKAQGENAAMLKGSGSLVRNVSLAPDTTYFYEYDTTAKTDIFSVEAQLTIPSGMTGNTSGYRVIATHVENFDDTAVDKFFTADSAAIGGGRYRIGYLRTKEDSWLHTQSGSNYPVRFTVPEGCKAVFTTDYAYDCDASDPLAKRLFLTREGETAVALDIPSAGLTRASGTYMHVSLLPPGSYTLSCSVQDRTKTSNHESSFWLDNLKVLLVEEGAAQETAGYQTLQPSSSVQGDGAMHHVSGSFTTPKQVLHYAAYPCQRVTGLNNAFAKTSEEMRGYTKTLTLDLTIPAGRQALYTVFTGTGKGGSYTSSNTGKTRYYSANWSFDDVLYGINTKESNGILALYALPENVRFVWKNLNDSHTLKATANTNYGAKIAFSDLLLYVSDGSAIPAAVAEGRFFESAGQLYAEDLIFSGGGRVRFTAPDGTAISNLRIYSVSGSSESEMLVCSFKDENDLAKWTNSGATTAIQPFKTEKEEPARVYAKGETINYQIFYSDWENDPSKKQHWVYTHEALTDWPYPQAGKDLSAPVTKFYIDGKYTLTHWQEDSTGTPSYDKESNKVSITFYIQSGPSNDAPWIKDIKTSPSPVKQGNTYTVQASVDDKDKDPLTVTIEVYKDQGSQPIGRKTVKDLKPDASGKYPAIVLSGLPKAEAGTYDIVVSVSDGQGADVESMRFKVKEERSLTGSVTHTAAWESNRLAWNEAKKGTAAVRPANMFWPGEVLVLNAPAGGEPTTVDAVLVQFPQYTARLTRGAVTDGKVNFTGQLWHSSMLTTIGTAKPVPATVRFTARYPDGETLTWDVAIIFDQSYGSYYQLHRNY